MILERFLTNGQKATAVRTVVPARIIGGLPLVTAIMFIVMFVAAFYAYTILWRHVPVSGGDSSSYLEVAQDLKDLSLDQPHYRTAGYPLLLVLTGSIVQPTRLLFNVQLLLNLASIWLLASILYAAGVGALLIRLFGVVLLLPPYMESAAYALTEALTQFLLVLGLAGIAFWYQNGDRKWLIASAVAIAYSAITRPANQALAFALVACLFVAPALVRQARITRRDIRRAGLILVGATLALVGAYSAINYVKFHYAGITYSLGYNLGTRTARVIERLPDEYAPVRDAMIKVRDAQLIEPNSSHTGYQYIIAAGPELEKITGLKPPELSNYLLKLNLTLIRLAPLEYLQDAAWGMASYWFPSTRSVASFNSSAIQLAWSVLHFGFLGIFVLQFLTFLGLTALGKSKRIVLGRRADASEDVRPNLRSLPVLAYILAGTIVIYTMLLTCFLDVGQPRQRTSTESLFIFMVFLGASMWMSMIRPPEAQVHSTDTVEQQRKVEAWLRKEEHKQTEQIPETLEEPETEQAGPDPEEAVVAAERET